VAHTAVRNALRAWLAACLAIMLFEGCLTLRHVVRRFDGVRAPLNNPEVQARLARLEPVALLTKPDDYQELLGPLLLPIGARYVTYVRPEEAATADARLLERLRRLDVRYIICERGLPLSKDLRDAVEATIPSGPLDLLDLRGDDPP
jgi:hypothetical protein